VDLAVRKAEEKAGVSGRVRASIAEEARLVARLDRELMATAVSEAVLNALQASGEGIVTIRAWVDASGLTIEVRDVGCGMSARALKHAFDPFFSEKPAGRGTGLGLTRARRLLELHGGSIVLESAPGEGTTATLRVVQEVSGRGAGGPKTDEIKRAA
jgi:signal transduction histidine kinase